MSSEPGSSPVFRLLPSGAVEWSVASLLMALAMVVLVGAIEILVVVMLGPARRTWWCEGEPRRADLQVRLRPGRGPVENLTDLKLALLLEAHNKKGSLRGDLLPARVPPRTCLSA